MVCGAGGSEAGYGVGKAVLCQCNYVHVAFGDKAVTGFLYAGARLVQAVEFLSFVENGGFRRVEVFGFALAEYAPAQRDAFASDVANGEDNAFAKTVVAAVFAGGGFGGGFVNDQSRLLQQSVIVVEKGCGKVLPALWRVAQAVLTGNVGVDVAVFQVLLCFGVVFELCAVVVYCGLHGVGQPGISVFAARALYALLRGGVVLRHGQPRLLRQCPHGFCKAHAQVFHQKADGVAVFAAAKAVVELFGGTDGERGRFFAVERAQPTVVGTSALELYVLTHHLYGVGAVEYVLNEVFGDCHREIMACYGASADLMAEAVQRQHSCQNLITITAMSKKLKDLFEHNRNWAADMERQRPGFFTRLKEQQNPQYMWIGCADSRVPANQITGLEPGEVFVHRNIANIVVPSDLNALSVMQYAIDHLKVKHLLIVGHFGCGGVEAALNNIKAGLVENWLRHIKDIRDKHMDFLSQVAQEQQADALAALNVVEQVVSAAQTTIVQSAWESGQELTLHGWIYSLSDGLLQDLFITVSGNEELKASYGSALEAIAQRFVPQG